MRLIRCNRWKSVFKVLKPGGIVYIKDFFEKNMPTSTNNGWYMK